MPDPAHAHDREPAPIDADKSGAGRERVLARAAATAAHDAIQDTPAEARGQYPRASLAEIPETLEPELRDAIEAALAQLPQTPEKSSEHPVAFEPATQTRRNHDE